MHEVNARLTTQGYPHTKSKICIRGFSLIELAVAMVILGLLLVGFMVPFGTQFEQRNQARTQASLDEIRLALYGFAMANGRLPRPADSVNSGSERDKNCESNADCVGYVPWVTLGVSATDAWGKVFTYGVTKKFSDTAASFTLADTGEWNIETRLSEDPIKISLLATRVVAVIHSFGARNFGATMDGADIANSAAPASSPTNVDEMFNSAIARELKAQPNRVPAYRFRAQSTSDAAASGGQFDDQVIWIPTSLFMSKMVEAKRLP